MSNLTDYNIIFSSREDANKVIECLLDIISKYKYATISDLLDLVGLPSVYADQKFGWTVLKDVIVKKTVKGYFIDLPRVEDIQ